MYNSIYYFSLQHIYTTYKRIYYITLITYIYLYGYLANTYITFLSLLFCFIIFIFFLYVYELCSKLIFQQQPKNIIFSLFLLWFEILNLKWNVKQPPTPTAHHMSRWIWESCVELYRSKSIRIDLVLNIHHFLLIVHHPPHPCLCFFRRKYYTHT